MFYSTAGSSTDTFNILWAQGSAYSYGSHCWSRWVLPCNNNVLSFDLQKFHTDARQIEIGLNISVEIDDVCLSMPGTGTSNDLEQGLRK